LISNQLISQSDLSNYQFRETVELINYVENAAEYFSDKGKEAFWDFGKQDSKWFYGNRYLFLYSFDGVCVFHPVNKELQGQNVIHLEDMNHKPVIQYIIDIVTRPNNPKGWVHYLWAERGEIFPSWKSAYVMKVEGPDGTPYAIGSGTYDIRFEKQFMVDIVDSAASLIASEGESAFEQLMDKKSIYYFKDIYVFVISPEGKAIVDPAFPGRRDRDLIYFQDRAGKYVVQEIIEKLEHQDRTFMAYIWPQAGQSKLSKKIIYARKVIYDGGSVIVGSGIFQINPIWNKF
jgi:signal transduction histidine kinase